MNPRGNKSYHTHNIYNNTDYCNIYNDKVNVLTKTKVKTKDLVTPGTCYYTNCYASIKTY